MGTSGTIETEMIRGAVEPAARLRQGIAALLQSTRRRGTDKVPIDDRTRQQLESLGYLE